MIQVEQIYTGCLAQGAYYIKSGNEAVLIDPLRETKPYLNKALHDGVDVKYVFETHFHADFVSGHLDISRATNAKIVFGPTAKPEFDCIIAEDGQEFKVGNATIKVIHTPGHTMESMVLLLLDENRNPQAIFTGDTLFLGDVGRPDLAQKSNELSQEDLAGMLYDSLYNKILPLPDHIMVYPAHGAGSACGKNMMKETQDTLGNQKSMNYALNQPSKEAFIHAVLDGLSAPPAYFPLNVHLNKTGYRSFDEVKEQGLVHIPSKDLEALVEASGALLLDTRPAAQFSKGFIPRSINIGLDGQFAPWVGALIADIKQAIIVVAELGKEEEVLTRLARVGFDNIIGFVDGGFEAWKESGMEVDFVNRISPKDFEAKFSKNAQIVDIRREGEFMSGHLENALSLPLDDINTWFNTFNPEDGFFLHCAGGYRSMIAASILKSRGVHQFYEIDGGYKAITETQIPVTVGK